MQGRGWRALCVCEHVSVVVCLCMSVCLWGCVCVCWCVCVCQRRMAEAGALSQQYIIVQPTGTDNIGTMTFKLKVTRIFHFKEVMFRIIGSISSVALKVVQKAKRSIQELLYSQRDLHHSVPRAKRKQSKWTIHQGNSLSLLLFHSQLKHGEISD